ncbi:MAG: hypothetical protein JWM68_1390 [Verrucomicrobiales bacterium]|nr:hypothetical protein [Verrucomicrobiales bacterium]
MTEQEFDLFRKKFQRKRFPTRGLGPLTEAVLRTKFQREKLKKLISAAESVRDSAAVARTLANWKQRLARMEGTRAGVKSLKKEVAEAKLQVKLPPIKYYVSARRIRTE